MLSKILISPVIHIDETSVSLRKNTGYVWVLTNMEEAVFLYRPTREGVFIKELLEGFDGVLVSDYYSAYDSLSCKQQKCLIHLIRDLNDDLYKNPFDSEFKTMVKEFSSLLRAIVETIDGYGLKSRYLRRYSRDVTRFYKKIVRPKYTSEAAIQYQRRFKKNRNKLFTFINFDGVSWNNNPAEHAIKNFATYRRSVKGLLTERSLNDYLILLSIYQTCQYKSLNFLNFLLSQDRSIAGSL
jgi:hypothetical protein